MKTFFVILGAGLVVTGGFFRAGAETVDAIEAVVHDSVITRQDVEELTEPATRRIAEQSGNDVATFRQKLAEADRENLESLIRRHLILHEFKTAGYSLPESVIEDQVEQIIRERFGDERTLFKTLQEEGITKERYRRRIRDQFIVRAMTYKNLSSEIIVSPHKIEIYYQAHKDEYKVEDQVKLRMIVLNRSPEPNAPNAKEMAKEIVAELDRGAAFSEMAAVYSQGSRSGTEGEWYTLSGLRPELRTAAASLKPGQHSGVLNIADAFYVIEVDDAKPAHFKAIGDVRDVIERKLKMDEEQRLEKQWIDRLKKKTFVQYY